MLRQRRNKRGLEQILGQFVEQPIGPNQFECLFLRVRERLLSVDPFPPPQNQLFLTLSVLPANLTLGVSDQDQIHRFPDSPRFSDSP
jgi:hypothetical protein